jgi:hypothetical protein
MAVQQKSPIHDLPEMYRGHDLLACGDKRTQWVPCTLQQTYVLQAPDRLTPLKLQTRP